MVRELANDRLSRPQPTSEAVSAVMRGNVKVDTKPELQIRSLLHRQGFRFRKNYLIDENGFRVRPDVVFTKVRLAVFIDGCFWHNCPQHGRQPRSNSAYWKQKLERNFQRDRLVDEELAANGWKVLRVWEHLLPMAAVEAIRAAIEGDAGQRLQE